MNEDSKWFTIIFGRTKEYNKKILRIEFVYYKQITVKHFLDVAILECFRLQKIHPDPEWFYLHE